MFSIGEAYSQLSVGLNSPHYSSSVKLLHCHPYSLSSQRLIGVRHVGELCVITTSARVPFGSLWSLLHMSSFLVSPLAPHHYVQAVVPLFFLRYSFLLSILFSVPALSGSDSNFFSSAALRFA